MTPEALAASLGGYGGLTIAGFVTGALASAVAVVVLVVHLSRAVRAS